MINNTVNMRVVPDAGSGVWDEPGSWSVLVPLETPRINLARNSSAELSGSAEWTQGYSGSYAVRYPERSTQEHWIGNASFKFGFTDPDDGPSDQIGFWFTPRELGTHMISFYMKKEGALKNFEINFGTSDPTNSSPAYVLYREWDHFDTSETDWFRYAGVFTVTSAAPIFVRIRATVNNYPEVVTAWIDGILIERAAEVLPYFDGSSDVAAEWTGAIFASESVLNYEPKHTTDYGFTVTNVVGGNAMMWNTISTPLVFGGGHYQRSTPMMTELSLVGSFESDGSRIDLERKRRKLALALSPRAGIPARLIYQPRSRLVEEYAGALMIEAVYTGGLEGNLASIAREDAAIMFRIHTTYMATSLAWDTFPITLNKTLALRSGLIRRDPNGVYHSLPDLGGYQITTRVRDPAGILYAAMRINATTVEVIRIDEENNIYQNLGTFVQSGGGAGQIFQLDFDPSGRLWAAGRFNQVEGGTMYALAYLSGGVWSSPISSITEGYAVGQPYVSGFVFTDTELYIGGNFNAINGSTRKNWARFASNLGLLTSSQGINGATGDTLAPIIRIIKDQQGRLYVYGLFGGVGVNTSRNLWSFQPSTQTWEASFDFAAADSEQVLSVEVLVNGTLLVFGTFTEIDGEDVARVVILKGLHSWMSVPRMNDYIPVYARQMPGGNSIQIASTTEDVFTGGWVELVNLSNILRPEWRPNLDPAFDGGDGFSYIQPYPDGTLYLGGAEDAGASSVTVPNTNVLTNEGDSNAWPRIMILGPINLFRVTNHTTGALMHFNLTLATGDVAILQTGPQFSFTSKYKGDLSGSLLPGSQPSDFMLVPGDNYLNFGADDYGSSDLKIIVEWRETFESISAVWDEE